MLNFLKDDLKRHKLNLQILRTEFCASSIVAAGRRHLLKNDDFTPTRHRLYVQFCNGYKNRWNILSERKVSATTSWKKFSIFSKFWKILKFVLWIFLSTKILQFWFFTHVDHRKKTNRMNINVWYKHWRNIICEVPKNIVDNLISWDCLVSQSLKDMRLYGNQKYILSRYSVSLYSLGTSRFPLWKTEISNEMTMIK